MAIDIILPNAEQVDSLLETAINIADKIGALQPPSTWAGIQAKVRAGLIGAYASVGDQMIVDTNEIISASVVGTGITAATVDKDSFLDRAGTEYTDYEFTFDGAAWHYENGPITLADFGISITGTPVAGDIITIHRSATAFDFDVEGIDEEIPVDTRRTHVLSLVAHKISFNLLFDSPQFLYAVTADAWPSGLPAGTYNITLDHGAYGGGTGQDGTYQFTTTKVVPVGCGIRHSTIGVYQSGGYNKSQITGGTITTYSDNKQTTLEAGITVTEESSGTSLGTTTANNPSYKVGDYINFSERNAYGSNRWSTSWARQVLNSADPVVQFLPGTIWSTRPAADTEGYLHQIDPELRAVLGKIRKRYAKSIADGYGYEDIEDIVTLDTMLDVFGTQNNSISEGSVDRAGALKRTTAMAYWKEHNTDAERIKYLGTTARNWWLSSPNPSYAHYERVVSASGALYNNRADNAYGVAPRLQII